MRAIDATLLESKINEFVSYDVNDIKCQQHREGAKYAVRRIRKIIQGVPKLDVQPVVHGKWVFYGRDTAYTRFYRCSCCNYEISIYEDAETNLYKYYPDCGVKNR